MTPPNFNEPLQARLLRVLWNLTGQRSRMDVLLTSFLNYRRYLPELNADEVIPNFHDTEIRVTQLPRGTWSTPLADLLVVLKAAAGFRSQRILELGSFQGYTTRLLAENTSPEATICAVDIDPRHGAAYEGLPIASKIIRKTGAIDRKLFGPDEKFDFIFVDADHDFRSVMNDTEVAFHVLAPGGVILWHDYHNISYFHGLAAVPEALQHFAQSRALVSVRHTTLALYSEYPNWKTADRIAKRSNGVSSSSVWEETGFRG